MTSFEWVLAGDNFSPIRFAIERASAMTEGIQYNTLPRLCLSISAASVPNPRINASICHRQVIESSSAIAAYLSDDDQN